MFMSRTYQTRADTQTHATNYFTLQLFDDDLNLCACVFSFVLFIFSNSELDLHKLEPTADFAATSAASTSK